MNGVYHLLYIDDEPGLLEIGKMFLEREGEFSVDVHTTPPASLPLLGSAHYDAIISDYQMPDMTGIEFLKEVRASGNRIPFILFTGRGREEVVIQALNEGADFYLQKGGDLVAQFTELAHKIRRAIQERESEAAVIVRESYLTAIIENQPGLVWLKDRDSRFLATNKAFALSCGERSAADLFGKSDLDIWPQDLAEKYRADDAAVIREKTALQVEEKIYDQKQEKWFETFKMPVVDQEGVVIGTTGFARDITERKRFEEDLKISERKFAAAFEESPDPIALTDIRTGTILEANNAFAEQTGFRREEILGRTTQDLNLWVHPEERDEFVRTLNSGGAVHNMEVSLQGKTREVRAVLLSGKIIEAGENSYMLSLAEDITERRRAETALRESEERLSTILNAAQVGIILVDAKTHQILLANPRALEMMKASAGEVIGAVCHTFICPAEKGKCPVTDLGQSVNSSERVLITKDGSRVPVIKTVVQAQIGGRDVLVESFLPAPGAGSLTYR